MSTKSFHLALEIDRSLKLNLNNKQFNDLANIISRQENGRKFANELMTLAASDVISKIKTESNGE